ncbi:hypothetical protein BDF19DRAFT_447986 [Syncephalis fuscata]|nr:hypothetical protein BDF19DRAFT_447986 [Syncephalis fuscata]
MAQLETNVGSLLAARLQDVIYYSLDQILLAYEPSNPVHAHLLARCYCAVGQTKAAYELLRGNTFSACRYLFAWCAVKLDNLSEAENALTSLISDKEEIENDENTVSDTLNTDDGQNDKLAYESTYLRYNANKYRCAQPDMAAVYSLLASVYRKLGRVDLAQNTAQKALKLNPFLWHAFETLYRVGDARNEQLQGFDQFTTTGLSDTEIAVEEAEIKGYFKADLLYNTFKQSDNDNDEIPDNNTTKFNEEKELYNVDNQSIDDGTNGGIYIHMDKTASTNKSAKRTFTARSDSMEEIQERQKLARIDSSHEQDTMESTYRIDTTSAASEVLTIDHQNGPSLSIEQSTFTELSQLLRNMAIGIWHLAHYRCQRAIDAFAQLPETQSSSGWVCTQKARAYFEMSNYNEAEALFRQIREREPYRMDGQEYYSTLLWHLHRDAKISALARELIDMNRKSPQAWCALGNCFSLQRDRNNALKCFERAIKLDPAFAYAYTLCGHERFSEEDWDHAQTYYRKAIRLDSRHYNAWYGLGMVYLRLDRPDMAEKHFLRAIAIHSTNPALICCLGMVYERLHDRERAAMVYARASQVDPRSTLVRFKYAKALMELGRNDDALKELTAAYQLGDRKSALRHYTWALNLATRRRHVILEAIQRMDENTTQTDDDTTVLTVGGGGDESVFV